MGVLKWFYPMHNFSHVVLNPSNILFYGFQLWLIDIFEMFCNKLETWVHGIHTHLNANGLCI